MAEAWVFGLLQLGWAKPEILNPCWLAGRFAVVLKTVPVGVPLAPEGSPGDGMLTSSGFLLTTSGVLLGTL